MEPLRPSRNQRLSTLLVTSIVGAVVAEFVADTGTLPAGSPIPDTGPPCPLATVDHIRAAADVIGATVPSDVDPWYAFAAVDAELQADAGGRFTVVTCLTPGPGAPVLF